MLRWLNADKCKREKTLIYDVDLCFAVVFAGRLVVTEKKQILRAGSKIRLFLYHRCKAEIKREKG